MINSNSKYLMVYCNVVGDRIYLIENENRIVIEFKYSEKGYYYVSINEINKKINDLICIEGNLQFYIKNNLYDAEFLKIGEEKDILKTIEICREKYYLTAFVDNQNYISVKCGFTEKFKREIDAEYNKLSEIFKSCYGYVDSISFENNTYDFQFKLNNENGDNIIISDIFSNYNHSCNIVLKNELEECVYFEEIIFDKRNYIFRIDIGKLDLENICGKKYNIYLKVNFYSYKLYIPLKIRLLDYKNNVFSSELVSVDNLNLISTLTYGEDNDLLSLMFNKPKIKVDLLDVQVLKETFEITTEISMEARYNINFIKDAFCIIKKRSSSISSKFNNYIIEGNIIKYYINKDDLYKTLNLGLWDIYVEICINSESYLIRLKNNSDIENKKNTIIFPLMKSETDNKVIKPYYTLDDHLSFEVMNEVEVSKVDYIKLLDNKIYIKGEIKSLQLDDVLIINEKVEFSIIDYNLEKINIEMDAEIKKIGNNLYGFNFSSRELSINMDNNFKNKIFTSKFSIFIKCRNIDYMLPLNIDYKNILIDKVDYNLKNENYKLLTKLIYKILCRILPIKKGSIVFQSFGGRSYSGNPKYMYEYLVKSGYKGKMIWALRNQFEDIPDPGKKVKIESLKYYYYLSRAEYVVSNLNMQDGVKKRKKMKFIQTWHGTPLKKISFDVPKNSPSYDKKFLKKFKKRVSKWDLLLAQNNYSKDRFKSAFKYDGLIDVIGHPINDILVENSEDTIMKIKDKIKIDKEKKVILYAPTWRDKSKYVLDLDLEELHNNLSDEYIILVKSHYFVNTSLDTDKYSGFVYDVSKYGDIQELILISDILITDYSSVMFDFAVTRKPMIFFAHDLDYYKSSLRGFYFDFEKVVPGPIVSTTLEVAQSINNIESISEIYHEKYNNFINEFIYLDDGRASERACISMFSLNSKKKDIFFLSFNIFGMGGTGRTVINTANYLANRGYNVELISVFGDKNDQYFGIDEKVKVTVLDKKKKSRVERILKSRRSSLINKKDEFYNQFSLLTDFKILKTLYGIKGGVVVSTRPGFNIMIAKYVKMRRFKVIAQEHLNFHIHPKELQSEIKKYYKKLDVIMTLTDADTNDYIKNIPALKNKIIKIPNAVPELKVNNDIKAKNQIIAAGRLVDQKGFDLLIKASKYIVKECPEWSIKIYGKGRDEQYLKCLIAENDLQKNVFLMGPSKNIEENMKESKIFVLSSRYEGFGMVIVEAMKVGIPVVSFDCPEGPREIITDGYDGVLVESENIKELANQVIRLIENEKLRQTLATRGRESVNRFDLSIIGSQWIKVLLDL